jgi:hypothetical protein
VIIVAVAIKKNFCIGNNIVAEAGEIAKEIGLKLSAPDYFSRGRGADRQKKSPQDTFKSLAGTEYQIFIMVL